MLTCCKCGRELALSEQVYPQVIGYAKPGKGLRGQSGSSLVLRERTGEVACAGCIIGELYGVTAAQLTFEVAP